MIEDEADWASVYRSQLSVPDNLAVELEKLIMSGALPLGKRIPPERELAELWGLSRTSVRDALKQLSLRGLIERRPGRGTVVVERENQLGGTLVELLNEDQNELLQVMEVRAVIEPSVTAKAALRARPVDVEELQKLLDEMFREESTERFSELDRSFHLLIARATGNPLLISLLERVAEIVDQSRHVALQSSNRRTTSLNEHVAILKALQARDPLAAEAAAQAHLDSIQTRITRREMPENSDNPSLVSGQ
ncbi:MAG TPA: FadR/GntR family transcriptional regulator [Acidimicrobiales bacterium]|nr:FadR/GntR family transcriptional regulator [Acidimicrobiales bacterium]